MTMTDLQLASDASSCSGCEHSGGRQAFLERTKQPISYTVKKLRICDTKSTLRYKLLTNTKNEQVGQLLRDGPRHFNISNDINIDVSIKREDSDAVDWLSFEVVTDSSASALTPSLFTYFLK